MNRSPTLCYRVNNNVFLCLVVEISKVPGKYSAMQGNHAETSSLETTSTASFLLRSLLYPFSERVKDTAGSSINVAHRHNSPKDRHNPVFV